MLPRLQAEEQLAAIEAGGLAFGAYEKDTAREKMTRLHRLARGPAGKVRKANPAQLAAMGVKVISPASEKAMKDV